MSSMTPTEVLYALNLFRAARSGGFSGEYARYEAVGEPSQRSLYLDFGTLLERAMRARGSKSLRALIGWLLRRQSSENASAVDALVDSIDHLASRRDRTARDGVLPDHLRLARAFGTFVYVAAAFQRQGTYAENEALAAITAQRCRQQGLSVSVTDVLRALRERTAEIPLQKWIDAMTPAHAV